MSLSPLSTNREQQPLNVSILTVFPHLYDPFLQTTLIGRAQKSGLISCEATAFSSYVSPAERIDAPTFGHGAGMLLRPEVIEAAVMQREQTHGPAYKVFFCPRGVRLTQNVLRVIAENSIKRGHLMLLPARYEGMDDRVEREFADITVSIGDFVLMGGDLPAMILLEGVLRLIPGVVGRLESVEKESFSGPFLDHPSYTKPVSWRGMDVPDVIRSGNHAAMRLWETAESIRRAVLKNFGWMRSQPLTVEQRTAAQQYIPVHYVALMHVDVLVGTELREGVTSVTSIDIHDIARSSCTYGVKGFSIVTPLVDQQEVVGTVLNFWHEGPGQAYREDRYKAMRCVSLENSLDELISVIEQREGKKPIIISTSARSVSGAETLAYDEQSRVWGHDRPVLIVFGTGSGLSEKVLDKSDYILPPVYGLSDFNHLSVRSAVAIVLDRWLGLNEKKLG